MNLTKDEILNRFNKWLKAWGEYDLDAVMEFIHDEVLFENWDGITVSGRTALQKLWTPWFVFNGNFKFSKEDLFIDEQEQKITFQWRFDGPAFEKGFRGKIENRRGVDIVHLLDGRIYKKICYSKTNIQIDLEPVLLTATK